MRKIQYTLLILFTLTKVSVAQEISNVTIVADGSAPTKEKALTNALRNAIEKAFGAFISSSTKIENETLLYDQIASVAQGSIVSYDKIGEVQNSSSQEWTTTISALVSPGKIIAFTQSKGIEVAFKGSVFAQNALIEQYYKEQEPIVLRNFVSKIDFIKLYTYTLNIGEPGLYSNNFKTFFEVQPGGGNDLNYIYDNPIYVKDNSYQTFKKELYVGKYYIPIKIKIDKTSYFDAVINEYVKLLKKVAISDHFDWRIEKEYQAKFGQTTGAVELLYRESNGNIIEYNPILRNRESAEIIVNFYDNCIRALNGSAVAKYIQTNLGPLNDFMFFYPDYRMKDKGGQLGLREFPNNWLSYLPETYKESALIIYNVGTLDDLQKITSIKLNLE